MIIINGHRKKWSIKCEHCLNKFCQKCTKIKNNQVKHFSSVLKINSLFYFCKGCVVILKSEREQIDTHIINGKMMSATIKPYENIDKKF